MSNNNFNDEVSLTDSWNKLVQYKKIFLCIFFIVFIVFSFLILLTPYKYKFTQVIKIASADNIINVVDESSKIEEVFYPAVVHMYNMQAQEKLNVSDFEVKRIGGGALLLSCVGKKSNASNYKIIFQKIIEKIIDANKELVEDHKKRLIDSKINLEQRLKVINEFNKTILSKKSLLFSEKQRNFLLEALMEKIYLDQDLYLNKLIYKVDLLNTQIYKTYNTKPISKFIISDQIVGLPRGVLLILTTVAALFFGLLGVFTTNFVVELKRDTKNTKK
jgi:hypothetical protein